MLVAVVPAQNEAGRIGTVILNLLKLPIDAVIPVINGCTDDTLYEVSQIKDPRLRILCFEESLGIDIPRAVGACCALHLNASAVLFVDGDMVGQITPHLLSLLDAINSGIDLALVNCYPYITNRQKLASMVLGFRGRLNRELGLFKDLGLATPTHGPHVMSRRLLNLLELKDLAIPPITLAKAKKNNLVIKVVTSIPHYLLNSPVRDRGHAHRIAHTIIGDCLQALSFTKGINNTRFQGKHLFDGYNSQRRFDILAYWQQELNRNN